MRISDWSSDVCSSDLGALRAVGVDPQILVVDVDVDLLGLRQHRDGGSRGVDAPTAFGHRHTLHAVRAGLELQAGEDARAGALRARLLVAADLDFGGIDDLEAPALQLGVALVHAQEVGGKERRSEAHTSELQSPMRISYAVACF